MYTITNNQKPARRQVSSLVAVALLAGAVAFGWFVVPPAVAEWRAPGTFAETIGTASTAIPADAPAVNTLLWIQDEARAVLAELPGGDQVTVYVKSDLRDLGGPCGDPSAVACAVTGGNTMWLSMGMPDVRLVVVHEYMHLRTDFASNVWLRVNGDRVFANASVPPGGIVGLEGVADCGIQLLVQGWSELAELPYVDGLCTGYQLRLAGALLDGRPLWEVEE